MDRTSIKVGTKVIPINKSIGTGSSWDSYKNTDLYRSFLLYGYLTVWLMSNETISSTTYVSLELSGINTKCTRCFLLKDVILFEAQEKIEVE